jgi:hypothetical protein
MGTKTFDQLTVITSTNSTDKVVMWKDSSDQAVAITFADFGTNLSLSSYIKADGTVAMSGNLNLNGNSITNVNLTDGVDLSAFKTAYDAHVANTSNPHAVTAAQANAVAKDGSIGLTGNWDIGASRKILAEMITARSSAGLKLYEDGGTLGVFIDDTGSVAIGGTTIFGTSLLTVEGAITFRQAGSTRYRSSIRQAGGIATYTAFDDTGAAYIPQVYEALSVTLNVGSAANKPIYFDSSGNLGIAIAPTTTFHAAADSATGVQGRISGVTNSNKRLDFGYDTTNNRGAIQAYTNGSTFDPLVINAAGGNIAIGTTSTGTYKLNVSGSLNATTMFINGVSLTTGGASQWTTLGSDIYYQTGYVVIGANANGDTKLHIFDGSAGTISANADAKATLESSANVAFQLLCPAASDAYIYFGSPTSNQRGYIKYGHPSDFIGIGTSAVTRVIVKADTYPNVDNTSSFGLTSNRWTALWAVNGTIQTSDERAKMSIDDSDLGLDFVLALKPIKWVWPNDERPAKYETRTSTRPVTRKVKKTTRRVVEKNGKHVLDDVEEEVEETLVENKPVYHKNGKQVFEDKPVFNSAGEQTGTEKIPVTHPVVVTETVEEEVLTEEAISVTHERPHYGFSSQQVKQAMEAVNAADFGGYIYDKETDTYHLKYAEFMAPIVKAIQEMNERMNQLEKGRSD